VVRTPARSLSSSTAVVFFSSARSLLQQCSQSSLAVLAVFFSSACSLLQQCSQSLLAESQLHDMTFLAFEEAIYTHDSTCFGWSYSS
jgi:hypothetical protein